MRLKIVVCLTLASLACQPASTAEEGPRRSLFDWQLAASRPALRPGFLLLPDDSEPGDVVKCIGLSCGQGQVLCTTRVFPEKPEAWRGVTPTALAGDDDLALLARYGFIEDDVERLIQAYPGFAADAGQGKMSPSKARLVMAGDQSVVLSGMSYASSQGRQSFVTAVWIEKNRLHRAICTASMDEAASRAAVLDFLARR
jgi:hypothetical protein